MLKEKVLTVEQSASYLLKDLTGLRQGSTQEDLKNVAIKEILVEYGEPALPYLEKELKKTTISEARREAIERAKNKIKSRIKRSHKKEKEKHQ